MEGESGEEEKRTMLVVVRAGVGDQREKEGSTVIKYLLAAKRFACVCVCGGRLKQLILGCLGWGLRSGHNSIIITII